MATLEQGDPAPEINRTAHNGDRVDLAACRGRTPVVLYFYPKDETAICTAQACSFRDHYAAFNEIEALVVGVSGDDDDSHRRFAENHGLKFPLLADTDGSLRQAFDVQRSLCVMPGRVTFVIDTQGMVRLRYSAQLAAGKHVDKALSVLHELSAA